MNWQSESHQERRRLVREERVPFQGTTPRCTLLCERLYPK